MTLLTKSLLELQFQLFLSVQYLYERCLRLMYNYKIPSFEELLDKDRSILLSKEHLSICCLNFKYSYRFSAISFCPGQNRYNIKQQNAFLLPSIRLWYHIIAVKACLTICLRFWHIAPLELK